MSRENNEFTLRKSFSAKKTCFSDNVFRQTNGKCFLSYV